MPYFGLGAGLALIWFILQRYMGKRTASASGAEAVDSPELARYRERIEREMARQDGDEKDGK